jgi:hypothetical protein
MITKQKIKRLEKSVEYLRGEKIYVCLKKYADQEVYSCGSKAHYSQDSIKKYFNFRPGDILVVIIGMGIDDNIDKNLLK